MELGVIQIDFNMRNSLFILNSLILGALLTACVSATYDQNKIFSYSRDQGEKFNGLLYGKTKEDVLKELGKPNSTSIEEWPYTHSKAGEDILCKQNEECEDKIADERWVYYYVNQVDNSNFSFTLFVFFKNEIVVAVR